MRSSLFIAILGILLIIGSFWLHGELFTVQLYDTYFVVGWSVVLLTVGLICCLSGGAAFLLANKRTRQL